MSTLEELRAEVIAAEAALESIRTAAAEAGAAWDRQTATLGREPAVPPEPRDPVAPVRNRPTAEQLAAARTLLDTAGVRNARHADHVRRLASAEREHARTEADAARLADRAEVVTAHLAAARKAPADLAAEQSARLSVGPVRVTVGSKGVEVLYVRPDGTAIPFLSASTGERDAADPVFRARLRELAADRYGKALSWLPIVVDLAHVDGRPVDVPGLWEHRTTAKGTALVVTPAGAA